MITDAFHDEKEALVSPEAFLGEKKHICDVAVATFSNKIFTAALETFPHRITAGTSSANGHRPAYLLDINEKSFLFYLSNIGSCLASNDIIELQWQTGFTKLIMFGSAGSLDSNATSGRYVIPTHAYRDEGLSYHYAPPSDYIEICSHRKMTEIFSKLSLPYTCGKVWTTDAPYRETRSAVNKRKSEGCIAVEMELAGIQAVCSYFGIELYDFLVTGDILDIEKYDPQGLSSANHALDKLYIALKIMEEICR